MPDIPKTLQPITDTRPCGEDLSFSPALDAIVEARRFDDPTLDQGEWVTSLKEADWPFVVQQCTALLTSRSKDLRLAVWFAEANAKLGQFRGLGEGYELVAALCDRFWEGLYPLPDEGDYETRIGNLGWLLARSVQLLRQMPVTEGRDAAYSIADFDAARARSANAERIAAAGGVADDGPKLVMLEAARRKGSRVFYETLLNDMQYCQTALLALEKSVDACLGNDGPGFSAVKDALDNVMRTVGRFASEAGVNLPEAFTTNPALVVAGGGVAEGEERGRDASNISTRPAAAGVGGPLRTRAQALAQLRAVAEFFRRTEPHSPVAYLADKAAHWGDMPLHAWLRAVVKDDTSLAQLEELLGVPPVPTDDRQY